VRIQLSSLRTRAKHSVAMLTVGAVAAFFLDPANGVGRRRAAARTTRRLRSPRPGAHSGASSGTPGLRDDVKDESI
jgi:hypothetical protein